MPTDVNLLQFRRRNDHTLLSMYANRYSQRPNNQERAPRESEPQSLAIFEDIVEGYFEADLAGNLAFINEPPCGISDDFEDRLRGMNIRDYTDSETAKRMYELFSEIYRTGKPAKLNDFQIVRKDGTKCILEIWASLTRDSEGQPTGFRGIALDVTHRKQTEEALKETEKRYRSLFEESLDAIVITDQEGRFVDANKAALHLFGFSREETS
jgi:PAS domain S-box-containing protein